MATWNTIQNTEIAVDAPVTSQLMTKVRDNLDAVTEGANGAPKIQTAAYQANSVDAAALKDAAVGQAQLKTSTASGSIVVSESGSYSLTGGTYSWWTAGAQGAGDSPDDGETGFGNGNTAAGVIGLQEGYFGQTCTFYFDERYIQASPPYDMGDGEVGVFIYLMMNGNEPEGIVVAPDPTWAYHGATDITPQYTINGKGFRDVLMIPPTREEKRAFLNGEIEASLQRKEITLDFKNSDMEVAPHPWFHNDNTGKTVVMLDPVSDLNHRLKSILNEEGAKEVFSMIEDGYIKFDNESNNRKTPKIITPVNFSLK